MLRAIQTTELALKDTWKPHRRLAAMLGGFTTVVLKLSLAEVLCQFHDKSSGDYSRRWFFHFPNAFACTHLILLYITFRSKVALFITYVVLALNGQTSGPR